MARVIYVRVTSAEHQLIADAVRNARARSLQQFAAEAIMEAAARWSNFRPAVAEAACGDVADASDAVTPTVPAGEHG